MYKLLVVDDEPRQVRALAHIINQLRPDYEILTACDGQEALDLLSKHKVNILFTDIRMPVIDGLHLIEQLSKLKPSIKIIILSGYGEFAYAQKAIQFGVNEYIVKPISKTDLESVLLKVESALEYERYVKVQEEELKIKLDNSLPIYLDHQLNRWVAGKSNVEELKEIKSIFPYQTYGIVFITNFRKPQTLLDDLDCEFVKYVKFSMKEALNGIGHSISFLMKSDKCQLVTVMVSNVTFIHKYTNLLNRINLYIENIRDNFSVIATVGVSDVTEDIFEDIERTFQSAQAAVEQRFFSGLGKVIMNTKSNPAVNPAAFDLSSIESEIMEAVRLQNRIRIFQITGDTFKDLNESGIKPKQIKEDFARMLLNQVNNVSRLIDIEDSQSLINEIKTNSIRCEVYTELWHFTNEILCRILDILNKKLNDKNGILINKCKKFIEEKYMEDISLEMIAQKFFFNPSYFSNLFKSYMGLSFSEYLLKTRIHNAKNILNTSEGSMADVAGMVGFKDPTYFNRVFKKEVGISPLKYRQMNENG